MQPNRGRGGRGGGRGRGGGGRGYGGDQYAGMPAQPYNAMQPQQQFTTPGFGAAPQQQGFGSTPGFQQQPGMYQNPQGYSAPGGYQQGFQPNNGYSGRGAPGHGQKKPPKTVQHVQIDASMILNVAAFLQPGEHPVQLSTYAISKTPAAPGQAPQVRVYTGDVAGVMREFNFGQGWIQSRKAQMEGSILSMLSVDIYLFVGIQQTNGADMVGLVKAFNLGDGSQQMLQDPQLMPLPVAHRFGVRSIIQAGQFLITGGMDGQVKAWGFNNGLWNLHGKYGGDAGAHAGEVTAISGKCAGSLITASARGDVRSWRLVDGTIINDAQQAHIGPVAAIDVFVASPENQYVLTCGDSDGYVRMWSAPALVPLHQVSVQPPPTPEMMQRPANPATAMKIIQIAGTPQLFVGFRNGSTNVYLMKDTNNFERLGFVEGHERKTKVLGFDIVDGANMLCLVTDKGMVNWFRLLQ